MKKTTLTTLVLLFLCAIPAYGQYLTGHDHAGNYTGDIFNNQGSKGYGFGAWYFNNTDGGSFLASADEQGTNSALIDVNGKSFGMWANNSSDVGRILSAPLADGAMFRFVLAYCWDNGNRGFNLLSEDWTTEKFNFNINDQGYSWTGGGSAVSTEWTGYREHGVAIEFTFTRQGADLVYNFKSLTALEPAGSGIITNVNIDRVKFYVSGAGGGTGGNMYFNSLMTGYTDPTLVPAATNITIHGNVELAANQFLSTNNFTIPAGNSFTILSDATSTGSFIPNGTVTGNFVMQRFISGGWDWHFLSSPVSDQTIVGAGNFITFPGGIGDPSVDFYKYDETATTEQPWINIKKPDGALNPAFETKMATGKGYLVAYEGANKTKSFTGTPFKDVFFASLSYTSGAGEGWHLLGNPYPSAFEWQFGSNQFSGLSSEYYYIYNAATNGGGGGYEYFSDWIAPHSENANGFIPAGQGFFVKAASGGGSIVVSPFARAHNSQNFLKEQQQNDNLLTMRISSNNFYSDHQLFLSENGEAGCDVNDAFMLFSFNAQVPHIYSVDGTEKMVMNSIPLSATELNLPLGIRLGAAGTFSITATDISNFNSGYTTILEDTYTGTIVDLRINPSYSFAATQAGISNDRFVLHLKKTTGTHDIIKQETASVRMAGREMMLYNFDEGASQLTITDVSGRIVFRTTTRQHAIRLPENIVAGIYVVQVVNSKTNLRQKLLIR
jgi:hypothetical protein